MRILGIETSCDETALALVEGKGERTRLLRSLVASQVRVHRKYGGVVPEVAARKHAEVLPSMLREMLGEERSRAFDAIAVTAGPGLITSLRVGTDAARALAATWKKPLVAVNHLEGHIAANWLEGGRWKVEDGRSTPKFPALALVVSGGHTELVLVRDHGKYELLGATRDDAAGEAFDKVAKILGIGYPGGPAVARLAARGNPEAVAFPRPMIASKDFDFSFSGLKTAVLQYVDAQGSKLQAPRIADICASFQEAVVDVLATKTVAAAKRVKPKTVLLAGGVAANARLRERLRRAVRSQLPNTDCRIPPLAFTTDNAAMIAAAGYYLARRKRFVDWRTLEPEPQWEIGR